jgi:hypothetical protein
MAPSMKSFRDLHELKVGPVVQITRAGGFYRARFRGCANSVFGATPEDARRRLLEAPRYLGHDNLHNAGVRERIGRYVKNK